MATTQNSYWWAPFNVTKLGLIGWSRAPSPGELWEKYKSWQWSQELVLVSSVGCWYYSQQLYTSVGTVHNRFTL